MPDEVTLRLTIPPELGPAEDVIAEVRVGVEAIERQCAEERTRTGARVLGRRSILNQSWRDSPSSLEPRRNLRPRFAGGLVARVLALLSYRAFLDDYRAARSRWLAGRTVSFPPGTYWLARFAAVPV